MSYRQIQDVTELSLNGLRLWDGPPIQKFYLTNNLSGLFLQMGKYMLKNNPILAGAGIAKAFNRQTNNM